MIRTKTPALANPATGLLGDAPMPDPLRDELRRAWAAMRGESPVRNAGLMLIYSLGTIFIDWPLMALAALLHLAGSLAVVPVMARAADAPGGWAYRATFALMTLTDAVYMTTGALIWQTGHPYALPFSIAMVAVALVHMSQIRAIHMPYAALGLASSGVLILVENAIFYVGTGNASVFAVLTVGLLAALGYALMLALNNNRLHRENADGWAAALAAGTVKDQLLAQVSHELRTPLNAIIGLGHAEAARSRDPMARARLGIMVEAAQGLGVILDDILDLTAAEAGRLTLRPVPGNPLVTVEGAVALYRPLAEQRGLTLTLEAGTGLPLLAQFDPQRLRQCVANLLTNALRHTPAGEVLVRIGASPLHDRGGWLMELIVADSGDGIPDSLRDRLFQPFQRGPDVIESGQPVPSARRGLGLAISRALAREMGGDLMLAAPARLTPRHNFAPWPKGAAFRLTLRLATATGEGTRAGAATGAESGAASGAAARATFGRWPDGVPGAQQTAAGLAPLLIGRRVLVVDDIGTNRMVMRVLLSEAGAEMAEAAGGAKGLELLEVAMGGARPFDLVLLDLFMPGMDGMETLAAIRKRPDWAGLPVVAMTADAASDRAALVHAAGFADLIVKPVDPARLATRLAALLARPSAVQADPPAG